MFDIIALSNRVLNENLICSCLSDDFTGRTLSLQQRNITKVSSAVLRFSTLLRDNCDLTSVGRKSLDQAFPT